MEVGTVDPYATTPGPIDGSVLYDQDKHVSTAVWDGQERGALRCHEHTSKLDQWTLTPKQVELVEKAGFGFLRSIPAISLDNPLISGLVERWRRETNTFHLNVGEMTVTLKDVALLLGLAIDGEPVIGITYTACSSVCDRYLGRSPESGYTSGGMVKLSWLKEFFSRCPEDAPFEVIEQHTRAYLLYLVGSTIFSTTTGNKVPVMYLPLFENFDRCGQYAWGAAALAFLYRALGNASLKTQSTISGCLTLLQCWSYFHLNIGRPKLNLDLMHDRFPFVLRWKGKQSGPTANRDVVFYRKALDSLKPCDVEWLPYRNMDSMVIPDHIKSTLILGRSRTMLICFDKAERHLPNRCLRQYGMLQSIPDDVERWERKSRGVDGGVDLSGKMESELNEWMDRQLHIVDGDEGVDESEYMEWYLRITRKFIGRPISLSSEFQRTKLNKCLQNAGLRDIAHIADTFSTKGLDPQQIESISRIRYIAHECLRDQIGGPVMVSASPQSELGKRVRGKERVRRKGVGKRVRKDGAIQYNAVSEDEQTQFYGTAIEVGQLHLSHIDREMDDAQLCTVDSAVSSIQLIHADADGENLQLCDTSHLEVDQSELGYAAGEENNEEPDDIAAEFNHEELKREAGEVIKEELNHMTGEENIDELNAANEVHEVQHCDHMVIDNLQTCDASHMINDTMVSDAVAEVNHTQLGESSVVDQQQSNPTDNLVNSQLSHINTESETPSTKAAIEVSQHSSIETHEDISQKGDCSVAV
ncbi:protein MAIN-LIKE 2-like isoform X1 [Gastrolobium bilobum]|uniref:protein MAIN-LIKE 2-like isoform X1 n=1 Tax=Gastrolobium bilobum TaxID=150636 RepID=UPI002AAFA19F|nr:protein MAIN-LIKE 2-like isoform X1 [Gastrolobium bilobum]XP_061340293.1 protein MAIN-LIKE 2-like isoform X1 [Gastrolobium bilobum]XP_061340302.1 protein MAIN-LIKE 2-like isoform X1 [Gastrolobium bilobum]